MIPAHGIILAAGSGSKMPSLVSSNTPKGLLPIGNNPMFYHPLRALISEGIKDIAIIIPAEHESAFRKSLESVQTDELFKRADIKFLSAGPGTADAISMIQPIAHDIIVLSSDYVGDLSLSDLLTFHCETNASFTAALTQIPKPSDATTAQSRSSKSSKPPKANVDHYAVMSDTTLHALIRPSDIESTLTIPRSLLNIPDLTLRSDLFDPHVYIINHPAVQPILQQYSAISSLRFDLLPYLARRQRVLSKRADSREEVSVRAFITNVRAARANTAEEYLRINLEARGVEEKGKRKGKGKKAQLPFSTFGERVSVANSLVAGGTVGDKVSVKKSVLGVVTLESGAKVNGCVIMDDAVIKEGSNLSGCIICKGGIVEAGIVLKDCRIAERVSVTADAEGQDFVGEEGWGDDIEFC